MLRRTGWRAVVGSAAPLPVPFSAEYTAHHRSVVSDALDSAEVIELFACARRLPANYGIGLDERVVEYPWVAAQRPRGRVLDAGSALNHEHILDRFLPMCQSLHIVTLAPEAETFPQRGVSYVYADLRDLPFRDGYYDTVISISTLEHVGKDNARFGAAAPASRDPRYALHGAISELKRVLSPGGLLLISVPYGLAEDRGWMMQFDRSAVDDLMHAINSVDMHVSVFRYTRGGWTVSSLAEAADASYHDATFDKRRPPDLAVAARSVACLRAVR